MPADAGHLRLQRRPQLVAELGDASSVVCELVRGEAGGGAEADDARHVLGPGPQTAFLAGPDDERRERRAPPDVEGADALWAVALVGRDRQQVHAQVVDRDGDLADRLGGVGVDDRPVGPGVGGELGDGHQGAGLVLGEHHGHEGHVIAEGAEPGVEIEDP